MLYKDYGPGTTGGDSLDWQEKKVSDCPQRGNMGELDLLPDDADFYTKVTFNEDMSSKGCMEDFGDVGWNPLNEPVDQRRKVQPNTGWESVASDISSTTGKGSGSDGTEKR